MLRILALSTATPEVRPGEALAVRAVWHDPLGGRGLRWRWRLWTRAAADDPRACAGPPGASSWGPGRQTPGELLAAELAPGTETERTLVVYAIACPAMDSVIDLREGRLVCPQGVGSEAFRRVTVRATGALNRPPPIAAWTLDQSGRSIPLEDGASVTAGPLSLTLTPGDGAAEAFDGGSESLMASVYVSTGSVAPPRVVTEPGVVAPMAFRWTPGRVLSGGEVARVWAVLRDQRGGETVRSVTVTGR
ncbi:MAG: hypothetical protein IPN17_03015 [Deltaproteobacteria bacterium]|nr:hypothetical protein [Deltaproteobacteria bacterium]